MSGDYDEYANRQSAEELIKIELAQRANYHELHRAALKDWHPPKAWPATPMPMDAPVVLPPEIAAHLNDKRPKGRQLLSRGALSRREAIGAYGRERIGEIVAENKQRASELFAQATALKPSRKKDLLLAEVANIKADRLSGPNRLTNADSIKIQAAEKARVFAKERYGENLSNEYIIRYMIDDKKAHSG